MTIARTGNRIVDEIARVRARHQSAERRAQAEAKKAAGKAKASGGKFRGAGKAGRAAARRPAKGISAKRLKRQASGGKTAAYGLKDGAELIASNCGYDVPTISRGLSPKLRPEIKNQIERLTFSTPASSGKATAEEWRARVEFIRQELEIDDSFSFCASRHTDAEHDHIHLDFNRVNDQGKLWKDNQIGLRLAAVEEKIEQRFDLKLTRREDFVTYGNLSKIEIERATREGVQPVFLQIQAAIQEAIQGKPDVLTFISRLAEQGIAVRPNLKQGELNGFSYQLSGQSFTGKQVGANWAQLKTEVSYVESEHAQVLADLKKLVDAGATRPTQPARADTTGLHPIERSAPIANGRAKVAEPEPSAIEAQPARPVAPDRRAEVPQANPRLADGGIDGHADGVPAAQLNEDPIIKKIKARQAVIDKLRRETGERRNLAVELATRMEQSDLYRQRETVKKFADDHAADPLAVAIVKEHAPDLAPITPTPPIRQELPERLRMADKYAEPAPSGNQNYQFPTM